MQMSGKRTQDTTAAAKRAAAELAAQWVDEGMCVGLGTGSTASLFIRALATRVSEGLKVTCVATSVASHDLGVELGLSMVSADAITEIDITVDGADEIDPHKNMIKGGGGALLREKIIASISREMVVVVDESKRVPKLGAFPLPIEVLPFGFAATCAQIAKLGLKPVTRTNAQGDPYVTDGEQHLVDVDMREWAGSYTDLDIALHAIPGVVETGLFLGMAGRVVVGCKDGSTELWQEVER